MTIDYSDYAAAKHFLAQVDEWYKSLEFTPENKIISNLQNYSHWFKYIVSSSFSVTSLYVLGNLYSSITFDELVSGPIVSLSRIAALAIVAWLVGSLVGRAIEYAIDRVQPVSCVLLNRGDERILAKWKKSNRLNFLKAMAGLAATVILNLASSWIFERLVLPN
ncbi:hypothetical protein [Martelella mediterranea]|uniref:Uncharacterized protein n=1 Tax=Martelella mediterranea TaxID=293089 RepID=A0A4R3P0G1_9HYPH|nr:hypothetical protein [Martelella mediterranea]TCT39112.1 hypothetical protein EDC90_101477 [Martelella mediterranea]